jgi:hypothetical protein
MAKDAPARPPEVAAADPDSSEAEYALEYPVVCPRCGSTLKTVQVVRLLRTRVHFVSVLPRRGHVLSCPECRSILGGELTFA